MSQLDAAPEFSMRRELVKKRKIAGYAAVVVVAPTQNGCEDIIRISAATNTEALLPELQKGNWNDLHYRQMFWLPGLTAAQTICRKIEKFLTDNNFGVRDRWFTADTQLINDLMQAELIALRSPVWSHDELVAKLERDLEKEADRYAAGIV